MTNANKARMYNTVLQMVSEEVCNDERLAQLKSMPFIMIEKVEPVEAEEDYINGLGGVTPAFRRMWDSL